MPDSSPSSVIVVTTSDEDHFDLASELMRSVRSHSNLGAIQLGMLDVGLSGPQRDLLIAQDVLIARARWGFDSEPPTDMLAGCLAMLSRPFLPKYFPGFDVFVYLDSDTWVQKGSAITDLVMCGLRADFAIVPELHPTYMYLCTPQHPIRIMPRDAFFAVYGDQRIPRHWR